MRRYLVVAVGSCAHACIDWKSEGDCDDAEALVRDGFLESLPLFNNLIETTL